MARLTMPLRPATVLSCSVALVFAAGFALVRLPRELVPAVELPMLIIVADWPGASPRAVERHVARPIEEALQGAQGTVEVSSFSADGQASIEIRVESRRRLALYAADVADRLASLTPILPDGVKPRIERVVPEALRRDQGFMTLELSRQASAERLRRLAEVVVAPRLRSLPGISAVRIAGGERRELSITPSVDRLHAHGVRLAALEDQIHERFEPRHYGWLRGQQPTLLFSPAITDLATLRRLPVAKVGDYGFAHLSDVADVTLASVAVETISRVDGLPVVSLDLERVAGANLLRTSDRVRALLPSLRAEIGNADLRVALDQSRRVRAELADLGLRGALGWMAVAALLWGILGGRATLLVSFNAAVALAVGLIVMEPLGLGLNLLTLAALALLVGLLVDNSTVVLERYLAGRGEDAERRRREMSETWVPLLGSTLSTVAVFVPLIYLSGDLRGLFTPVAVLGAVTLLCSLVTARIFLPALTPWLGSAALRRKIRRPAIGRLALPTYRWAGHSPWLARCLFVLVVGLPWPLLPERVEEPPGGFRNDRRAELAVRYNAVADSRSGRQLRHVAEIATGGVTSAFLQRVELGGDWGFDREPELRVALSLPPGSGRARGDEILAGFETLALKSSVAHRVLAHVGRDTALLRVVFGPEDLRLPAPFELRESLIRHAISLAGIDVTVTGLVPLGYYGGRGVSHGYRILAYGPDGDRLESIADQLRRQLERNPRVAGVDLNAGSAGAWTARRVLHLNWDGRAAAATHWSARELTAALRPMMPRAAPNLYATFAGDRKMPVRVAPADVWDLDLRGLLGASSAMDRPAWRHFVRHDSQAQQPIIERYNQQYLRHLQVFYRGPDKQGRRVIEQALASQVLPPGYRLELPDPTFFGRRITRQFLALLAGTVIIILLVLAAVMESWRLAAAALISVPAAWVGVAFAFAWTGAPFAQGAFLGLLLVFGIAVNDAVLYIHRWVTLRGRHVRRSAADLAALALRQRLRPMWATSLTSICGMLPLLVLPGATPFWYAFAVTIAGGILASTLITPALLLPILASQTRG